MQEPRGLTNSRKRPLEDATTDVQYSLRYKIRAFVRDLRPQFIEVLKTPDFQNCKAADEIRAGMKQLIDLYRQLVDEAVKQNNSSNGEIKPREHHRNVKPVEHQQDVKPAANPLENGVQAKPSDPYPHPQGTYVVGGSAFGWNFITFNGSDAVYYGQTREAFRIKNPKSE
ncbi:uncharacterized protein LOC127244497 [Andrographis paniculata]|uniref:uncharacterized protein LOC127244497 n=1 Tax=Andrographis paniculata TaxID=175694 RepID=UPI0021E94D5B|nr:uncharacterized protein LOC127244497 [Andrographis paniculata]